MKTVLFTFLLLVLSSMVLSYEAEARSRKHKSTKKVSANNFQSSKLRKGGRITQIVTDDTKDLSGQERLDAMRAKRLSRKNKRKNEAYQFVSSKEYKKTLQNAKRGEKIEFNHLQDSKSRSHRKKIVIQVLETGGM